MQKLKIQQTYNRGISKYNFIFNFLVIEEKIQKH